MVIVLMLITKTGTAVIGVAAVKNFPDNPDGDQYELHNDGFHVLTKRTFKLADIAIRLLWLNEG